MRANNHWRVKKLTKQMADLKTIEAELLTARRIVRVLEWKRGRAMRQLGINPEGFRA